MVSGLYMRLSNTIFSGNFLKFTKYFVIGGIAAIVNLIVFFISVKILYLNYIIACFSSFVIATFVNYVLSIKYVFESESRFNKNKEIYWIYIISLIGLFGNEFFLYLFISFMHFEIIISQVIAIGVVFIWNFVARNSFVFKKLDGVTNEK